MPKYSNRFGELKVWNHLPGCKSFAMPSASARRELLATQLAISAFV